MNIMQRFFFKQNSFVFLFLIPLLLCSCNAFLADNPEKYAVGKRIEKNVFLIDKTMSTYAVNIVKGELDAFPGEDIGIFSQTMLYIVNFDGRIKSKIDLEWKEGILDPRISIKRPGDFEIVVCDGSPFGVLDKNGKVLWTYRKDVSANGMALGDLNNDGKNEYFIATDELLCLDNNGNVLWKKTGYYSCVDFVMLNATPCIVTANHSGKVQFWDSNGNIIRQWQSKTKLLEIHSINWMGTTYILTFSPDDIILMDLNGKEILRYRVPDSPTAIFRINGCTVSFADNYEYMAVVVRYASYTGKSMLCIFSPAKKLIYREMLEFTTGICNAKIEPFVDEILLVGDGAGKINRYSLNP